MSLIPSVSAPATGRAVPVAWFVVSLLVAAGVGVAVTAVLLDRPSPPPGSIVVTNDFGQKVSVPYDPARVAVLSPSIMDSVDRLGLRSHVVAVDCYAAALGGLSDDYSPDQIAQWNLTSSMCVQVGPVFVPSMLVNLTPQLVLASTIVSIAAVEEITGELGIPVVILQPPTLSGVLVDEQTLGEIFGVPTAANDLNAQLSSELYNATNVSSSAASFPTVLLTYSVDTGGYWTFGPGTFGLSMLEIVGATSISASTTIPYPELSAALVLSADPQRIVYGTGFGLTETSYAGGPDWSQFSAVKSGNLTGIDSNWITEPDPTMILEGIPALLSVFHPSPV